MDAAAEVTSKEMEALFREYVDSWECRERHSQAACDEVSAFDRMTMLLFPDDPRKQTGLYDKMMDVAVEFEESGFAAGYRMCLKSIQALKQDLKDGTTNTPPEARETLPEATAASKDGLNYISSKQIGKMFSVSNAKVVHRINDKILPYCSDEDRKDFQLSTERSLQNKYIEVYRLSKRACEIYLKHMEKWSGMMNVMKGIDEMKERMQAAFAS